MTGGPCWLDYKLRRVLLERLWEVVYMPILRISLKVGFEWILSLEVISLAVCVYRVPTGRLYMVLLALLRSKMCTSDLEVWTEM